MAIKKTTPSKKAAKPAATKPAAKKAATPKSAAPKKKGKAADEEDLEFPAMEDDEFKVDDDMEMNMFSDGFDDDDY